MNLILLGAQGSGKGTLAKNISRDFGLVQISTGDLFRESIAKKEKLGLKAQAYMNRGELVPIELTLKILNERISKPDCKKGFILDGFPRSIEQAEALKEVANIDYVINVELPYEECVARLTTRRTCPNCGDIDNMTYKGYTGNCRKCGTPLFQRDDDKPEAIKTRLEVYEKTTTPLINFYSDRLFKVSSLGTPEDTYRPVKDFLSNLGRKK